MKRDLLRDLSISCNIWTLFRSWFEPIKGEKMYLKIREIWTLTGYSYEEISVFKRYYNNIVIMSKKNLCPLEVHNNFFRSEMTSLALLPNNPRSGDQDCEGGLIRLQWNTDGQDFITVETGSQWFYFVWFKIFYNVNFKKKRTLTR